MRTAGERRAEPRRMTRYNDEEHALSRRSFLRRMQWAPVLLLPAPLQARVSPPPGEKLGDRHSSFRFADLRFTPHYPTKSPLDDVLRKVVPGTDEYVTEKYAFEI